MKKRLLSALLVLSLILALGVTAFAAAPTFEDLRTQWKNINKLAEDYWLTWDGDYDQYFDLFETVPPVSSTNRFSTTSYDFAIMRIKNGYLDGSSNYWYWDKSGPYYVLLEEYEGKWMLDGVLYCEGKVFSYVGDNDSWVIDNSKYNVYWSK